LQVVIPLANNKAGSSDMTLYRSHIPFLIVLLNLNHVAQRVMPLNKKKADPSNVQTLL
jgi:hypothetical protein